MKRIILIVSLAVAAWILSPTLQGQDWSFSPRIAKAEQPSDKPSGKGNAWGAGGNPYATPELDPSGAGSALILLLGGVAYLASRRREEDVA